MKQIPVRISCGLTICLKGIYLISKVYISFLIFLCKSTTFRKSVSRRRAPHTNDIFMTLAMAGVIQYITCAFLGFLRVVRVISDREHLIYVSTFLKKYSLIDAGPADLQKFNRNQRGVMLVLFCKMGLCESHLYHF